jgi:phosphoribosylformylglycinamidine cyclo-ligase
MSMRQDRYRDTGVDTAEADIGLDRIAARIRTTWPQNGLGAVLLPLGYFANVISLGETREGLAICTDGVGSKTIIAEMMGKYDTIGIDCVAMNVNDLICVGATPLSLVDYIAVESLSADAIDAIGIGLTEGARLANISITGGETAQLRDVIKGFDLVGTAVGTVEIDKIIAGRDIQPGDVVIGVKSNGIHSNGMSLARRVLLQENGWRVERHVPELGASLGEELLRPTDIYVRETLEIIAGISSLKAAINITGDGLLNLARVLSDTGFVIDDLIEPQPIFSLIQQLGRVDDTEMFEVFNMGIGFCYVVGLQDVERALAILKSHGREAKPVGRAVADPEKRIRIPQRGLIGQRKTFRRADEAGLERA